MDKKLKGDIAYIPDKYLNVTEIRPSIIWKKYLNNNVLVNRLTFLKKIQGYNRVYKIGLVKPFKMVIDEKIRFYLIH